MGCVLGGACVAGPTEPVEVLVADLGAREVLHVDEARGEAHAFLTADSLPVEAGPHGFEPSSLAWWGEALVVGNFRSGEVVTLDPDGRLGRVVYAPDREQPPMEEPVGLAWVGARLAVLGNDTRNVVLLDPHDATTAVELGELPIRNGHALLPDPDGRSLWVATSPHDTATGLVQRYDVATGERLEAFLPWGELEAATHLAWGPEGLLWVTDAMAGEVLRVDPATGRIAGVVASGLDTPLATEPLPDGRALVLERERLGFVEAGGYHPLHEGLAYGRALVLAGGAP